MHFAVTGEDRAFRPGEILRAVAVEDVQAGRLVFLPVRADVTRERPLLMNMVFDGSAFYRTSGRRASRAL